MYDYEDELKFHEAWYTFLYKYKVDGNTWAESICRKEKFAHCSMKKAYTIGMCSTQGPRMCSTQLSESFNSHLKEHMRSSLDIVQVSNIFSEL
jgi:hypothetical protein